MFKKIFLFSVIGIFSLGIFLFSHRQTYATLPVAEVTSPGTIITDIVNAGTNTLNTVIENALKPAAILIADQALSKLSNDVVSWANNGFDGRPGFITNYNDLIRGVEFDAINSSFGLASGIAREASQESNQAAEQQYNTCIAEAATGRAVSANNPLLGNNSARVEYDYEYSLVQCKINVSTNTSINEYNRCFATNNQAAINYATRVLTGPSAEFFDDFFRGNASPSNAYFANFSETQRLNFNTNARQYYEFMYKRNQCFNGLQQSSLSGDPAQIAQANYNLFQSGQINSTRAVAQTVADFGTSRLNDNRFEQLARGGGDLTLALLGSQGRKDDFKNDITAGGWEGILSLTGEGSTDLSLVTTARSLLGSKTQRQVALKEAVINLPTKLLDKTRCELYKKDENGNNTDECIREVTVTPGDLVAGQAINALNSEISRGEAFGDDLVGILIKNLGSTIGNLVNGGFGQLTNAAATSFFNPNSSSVQNLVQGGSGTDFQSNFNVLGIETSTSGEFLGTPLDDLQGQNQGSVRSVPESIGGPEDLNPQIIINFQELLELNINLATEEKFHFENIRGLTAGIVDVAYEFERCIPGPDYQWERRLGDILDSQVQEVKLGVNEMKAMIQDPQVTIPGGVEMREQIDIIFNTSRRNKSISDFRRQELSSVINTLTFIKSEINADFNRVKGDFNPNLVLFEEDWNILSTTQKSSALRYLVENQYYINPNYVLNGGLTILSDQALAEDEARIRTAAISQSWDIWRTTTPAAEKLELREAFFALQNNLSSSQFVSMARNQFNEMQSNIQNSYAIALDCMVFKTYALGVNRPIIAAIINNPNLDMTAKIGRLAEIINVYIPAAVSIRNAQSGLFDRALSGTIPGFNVATARTDAVLKTFLESERVLQTNNGSSVFSTPRMTLSTAINSSILGFNSELEKQEYFDLYYPDEWITHAHTGNRLSISEIYKYDIMRYVGTRGVSGLKGSLFCRIPGFFDRFGDSDNDDNTSLCFNGMWYPISRLNLQLIVSEINT
jgi:hypothetical protein